MWKKKRRKINVENTREMINFQETKGRRHEENEKKKVYNSYDKKNKTRRKKRKTR